MRAHKESSVMNFQMNFRHSRGNLHIKADGVFDEYAAKELLKLMSSEYPVGGRVFVDTAELCDIHPSGRVALGSGLSSTAVPASNLFFMGEKGFQIAPDGARVLIVDRSRLERAKEETEHASHKENHHCCGKCAHCKCRHSKHGTE